MLVEISAIVVVAALVWYAFNSDKERARLQAQEGKEVKPYNSIPGPWGLPIIGSFFDFLPGHKYEGQFHTWMMDMSNMYGPIMRQNLFGLKMVVISGVDLIEEMMSKDVKYPNLFLTKNKPMNTMQRMRQQPSGLVTR